MKAGKLPWSSGVVRSARPMNFVTGSFYTGYNWLSLAMREDRQTPLWMTFKQANKAGYRVRAGERGERIVLYAVSYFDPQTDQRLTEDVYKALSPAERLLVKRVPFMNYATVFNVDQLDDAERLIAEYRTIPPAPKTDCEQLVTGWGDAPSIATNVADARGYAAEADTITMPHRWQYDDQSRYYKALFHEMIHATGHRSRLNRYSVSDYENNRAFEEMVAEIGAAFLCNIVGIMNESLFDNTTAYVQHWIRGMENDEKYIFRAAAMAQKAVDYILQNQVTATNLAA